MNLLVVGISHKKAPLELRERFTLNEGIIPEVLRRLQSEPEIEEAVIISTAIAWNSFWWPSRNRMAWLASAVCRIILRRSL